MAKYMEVRREPVPGCCVHTIKQKSNVHERVEDEGGKDAEEGDGKQNKDKDQDETNMNEEMEDKEKNIEVKNTKQKRDGEEMDVDDNVKEEIHEKGKDWNKSAENGDEQSNLSSASLSHTSQTLCKYLPRATSSSNVGELSGPQTNANIQTVPRSSQLVPQDCGKRSVSILPPNSPESPVSVPRYYDLRSPNDNMSCPPQSFQSGSGYGSPTWSPVQEHSPSPGSSPPYDSSSTNPLSILLPLNADPLATCTSSPYISPPHSPIMFPHSPGVPSPPRSSSPIRVPSDWEYEDEEDKEQWDEDGRFSPPITDLKGNDGEENMEETEEEEEVLTEEEEGNVNRTESGSGCHEASCDNLSASEKEGFVKEMDEKLIMRDTDEHVPSAPEKRPLSMSSPPISGSSLPQEKKIKLDVESLPGSDQEKSFTAGSSENRNLKELTILSDTRKTPFKEINKIKFRLGNPAKRQLSRNTENKDVYSPTQVCGNSYLSLNSWKYMQVLICHLFKKKLSVLVQVLVIFQLIIHYNFIYIPCNNTVYKYVQIIIFLCCNIFLWAFRLAQEVNIKGSRRSGSYGVEVAAFLPPVHTVISHTLKHVNWHCLN